MRYDSAWKGSDDDYSAMRRSIHLGNGRDQDVENGRDYRRNNDRFGSIRQFSPSEQTWTVSNLCESLQPRTGVNLRRLRS
jgi:hypothetical protein